MMAESVMIPLRQADIVVVGLTLMVVLYPDRETGFVFPPFCAALDLDPDDQTHRLRKHRVLSAALRLTQVQTAGGPQVTNVLLTWGVSLWLGSLRTGRRSPEYQARIATLQREVGRAVAQKFASVAPAPEEPAPEPHATRPAREKQRAAPASPWELIYGGLEMMATGMEGLEQDQQAMYSEIVSLKGQVAEMQQRREERERTGPAAQAARVLSMDHILQLFALARVLEQQTGEPVSSLLRALAEQFSVADASSIPDANWDQVRAWLWQRGQQ